MPRDATERIEKRIRSITAELKRYFEKRIELLAITAGENYAEVIAKYVHKGSGLFLMAVAFIFLLVALAEFIGGLLESQPLGYIIVAVPLIIIGWLFYNLKPKNFSRAIQNELEEDVIELLNKYEVETDKRLSTTQIEETINEDENDGRRKY